MMDENSIVAGIRQVLEIRKKNGKELNEVLKAVAFRETGTIDVTDKGIRIVVDDQHSQQAIAYLPIEAFHAVILKQENVKLTIPINTLISTLSIVDHHESHVKLSYNGYGDQLRVMVEHDETVVDTMINTLSPNPGLTFDFDQDHLKASVIMKPSVLKEAFKEFDPSSSGVMFIIGPSSFSIQTTGDIGKITTTIPRTSDCVDTLECARVTHTVYRLSLMKKMEKALAVCSKISIRIDRSGIMICQFMMRDLSGGENYQIFLEFYCASDADQPIRDEEDGGQ